MNKTTAVAIDPMGSSNVTFSFDTPEECPMCHTGLVPKPIASCLDSHSRFSVLYFCRRCSLSFLTRYSADRSSSPFKTTLLSSEPNYFQKRIFPKQIIEVSQSFSDIYNQALSAETINLNEISGMGFRKAVEFLVKDFSIYMNPDKAEYISNPKFQLMPCIREFLPEFKIDSLATLCAWIGNDETHFSRINDDLDINDLKDNIEALISHVVTLVITKKAEERVNQKKLEQQDPTSD